MDVMTAVFSSMLIPTSGFKLGTLAGNLGKYGQQWGFDIAIALGAGLFLVGVKEFLKAINAQQGAGGHYFRGGVGCVLGAIMMFGARHFEQIMGGSDLFSQLIGTSSFIFGALTSISLPQCLAAFV